MFPLDFPLQRNREALEVVHQAIGIPRRDERLRCPTALAVAGQATLHVPKHRARERPKLHGGRPGASLALETEVGGPVVHDHVLVG